MPFFLTVIVILLVLVAATGIVFYFQSRKLLREQKNFERGLKMIPLLIHLPPISEDTEESGRDVRDVIDENISKAQVLYSIIASTLKKGFKSKFYGQRHFAFEIIGEKGFVHFYAAVPVAMVDVVKQAVVSAYPAAQLEEVPEHNIFSPVGRISGTLGGELTLKEHYAYPIATYQEIKRDAIQAILSALSALDKEDGAGIQIMLRPASPDWRKSAQAIANQKRKGSGKGGGEGGSWGWARQLGLAVVKPPEPKSGGESSPPKPELSSLDQAIVDAIDDKTRYPAYEVLIRIVASSNIAQRSQAILSNIVAAFSLFDAPGKNGFKYTESKDIESFVTAFILRFFPQESNKSILNAVELATLFHFPDQRNIPTSQVERQGSKQVDGPRNMPDEGLLLGYNIFRGTKKPVRLSLEDRRRHMYVVGQTGVGKSVYLENLALQDMIEGRGFAFVDPHGESAERLMSMVPKERTEDVIYFSPGETDFPLGLNLFEYHNEDQKDFIIQEAINMLEKLYDPNHQGIVGPRYHHLFRNAALTVMSDPAGGTFVDIPKLFSDPSYVRQKLKYVTDRTVIDFWTKEMPGSERSNEFGEVKSWFVSKFGAFLSNSMMRNIIGQSKSAFNLRDVMDNNKLLFVNLSKGRTGELNSKLLGMIFVMKFQAAAMSRADMPEDRRNDFCLYVDEFQNFSTDSFATILSEARKYRLNLIVANQFTTQLTDEIRDAVFGNVGSITAFRVGADADADALSRKFQPVFDREDILRLPNYNTITQILIGGVPTQPFSMATVPPMGSENPDLAKALKQLSAAKYGRPRAVVEKEVTTRLYTPAAPAGSSQPRPQQFGGPMPAASGQPLPAKAPSTGSSFLDEWLAKKRQGVPSSSSQVPPPPKAHTTPKMDPSADYATDAPGQRTELSNPPSTQEAQSSAAPIHHYSSPAPAADHPRDETASNPTQASPPKHEDQDAVAVVPENEFHLKPNHPSAKKEHTIFIDKD